MSPDKLFFLRITLIAGHLLLSASCFSPGRTLTPSQAEALSYTEEGESAFKAGRHDLAQLSYKAALDLHIADKDSKGIIRNLFNLAVVQHAAGLNVAARQSLDAIDRHIAAYPSSSSSQLRDSEIRLLLSEADWLKAHMFIDEGRLDQAQQTINRHQHRFESSDNPRFQNLLARLLLAQKMPIQANLAAQKAWKASKRSGDQMEQGDAARYQARSLEQSGRHAEASEWYKKALQLDQALSRQHLVKDDLIGLNRTGLHTDKVTDSRYNGEKVSAPKNRIEKQNLTSETSH